MLLQAAKNFEIDIWKINRKLLVQLLFTGQDVTERMDLLRDYISAGGSPELEEAFLYRCAYANVILKQPIHRYMVQMILRLCRCCLLYTSDAADDLLCVDLGGRRIIKKKNSN